jgi:periplasmic protein TonB
MTRSAKSVVKGIDVEDPRMGRVVNDNVPSLIPGHVLSDLGGYAGFSSAEGIGEADDVALISPFPSHQTQAPSASVPPMDAPAERPAAHVRPIRKRVASACLGSMIFHVALCAALITGVVAIPDEPVEEAGEVVSVVMLGDSDLDRQTAGEKSEEPKPEEVVADAVQPDVVQPSNADPVDPVSTVVPEPVQQVATETVVSALPEVLTASVPAEQSIVQPATPVMQPTDVASVPVPSSAVQPVEQLAETEALVPQVPAEVTPVTKPPARSVERRKEPVRKQPAREVKVKTGSEGGSEAESRKGSSEGKDDGRSDRNSESTSDRFGAGSAAVANYPGKIGSRIRRSVRVPDEYKRMSGMSVRIRLTIGSGGDLNSLSVVRSSGIAELDSAVVDGVRRAAPFPPLPPEWAKTSWSFTQEVQVTRN